MSDADWIQEWIQEIILAPLEALLWVIRQILYFISDQPFAAALLVIWAMIFHKKVLGFLRTMYQKLPKNFFAGLKQLIVLWCLFLVMCLLIDTYYPS
jgi:hypothetical protein